MAKKRKKEPYLEDTNKIYPKMSDSEIRKFRAKEDFYSALSITIYSIKIAIVFFIGISTISLVLKFTTPLFENLFKQAEELVEISEESNNDNKINVNNTNFCPYCGTESKSVYNYCTECGKKQN